MPIKILSFKGDPKVIAALIAAEYNHVAVEVDGSFDAAKALECAEFKAKNPLGKLPVLETCSGQLFEIDAILRFIGGLNRASDLLGASFFESAQVDQWVAFAHNQLAPVANAVTYPILEAIPFNKGAIEKAKTELKTLLKVLDNHLAPRTYLVGEAVTIADIAVVSALLLAFKLVIDTASQKAHTNLTRWFTTLVHQPHFHAVLGDVKLCTEAKEAQPAKKEGGGAAAAAPKPAKAPAPAPAAAAAAHGDDDGEEEGEEDRKPKAPHWTDSLPKSTMVMDAWKRCYSNEDTRTVAIPEFWKMYDPAGYSLWKCSYKYNSELSQVFMTSNLIGGWFQRLDRCHKFAFGNVLIFGGEKNMEIHGVWLFRGLEIPPEFQEADDFALYDFTRLDQTKPADKTLVEDFWAWDGKFEGIKLKFDTAASLGKTFK